MFACGLYIFVHETVESQIQELISGCRGVLQMALVCAPQEKELSSLLVAFNEAYPNISYYISERSSPEILQMLEDGVIDIGLPRWPDSLPKNIQQVFSMVSPYRVYYSKEHPKFSGHEGPVDLEMLRDIPICIPSAISGRFQDACKSAGFNPRIVCVCSTFPQTQIWAHSNNSVAIAASISDACEEGLVCQPLNHEKLKTVQYICYNSERSLSAACKTFINFCNDYYSSL